MSVRIPPLCIVAAGFTCAAAAERSLGVSEFGVVEGRPVKLFTLTNTGAEVRITEFGGIVVLIRVPDRDGRLGHVALGYDRLGDYVSDNPFFGTITSRTVARAQCLTTT